MALNGDELGAKIAATMRSEAQKKGATPETIWIAIAKDIVDHITNNAVVNTEVTTATGPGTGIGTVS